MRRYFLSGAIVLCVVTAACAGTGPIQSSAATPSESAKGRPSRTRIDSLILALRDLPGEFRYIDPERTGSVFDGSEALFRAVGEADTLAVPALIECFGDTESATATLDGQRLQHGKLCFRAFGYTRYYQQHLRSATWMAELKTTGLLPGRLNATDEQLRLAQDWWRRYFAAGSPIRP